jgi:hypothetical protein
VDDPIHVIDSVLDSLKVDKPYSPSSASAYAEFGYTGYGTSI